MDSIYRKIVPEGSTHTNNISSVARSDVFVYLRYLVIYSEIPFEIFRWLKN